MTEQPDYTTVRTQRRVGVLRLIFDRPDQGNALNLDMASEALQVLRSAEADPDIHLLTLTGRGRFFCAGGDVQSMAALEAQDRPGYLRRLARAAHDLALAMTRSRLLVVAGVNGPAAGAGLGLALNADWVLTAESAPLLAAYAGVGLTPDTGVSYWLPRLIGHKRSVDLTLNGRRLTGAEAVDWGLANQCVPDADFDQCMTDVEDRFVQAAAQVLGPTKSLLRGHTLEDYESHLRLEAESIAQSSGHPETVRLIDRFATK